MMVQVITFYLRHSQGEMYNGHGHLCVCLSVYLSLSLSLASFPHLLHGPICNFGEWYGVPSSCALLGGFAIGAWVSLL